MLYLVFVVALLSTFLYAPDKIVCTEAGDGLGDKYCHQYCYEKGSFIRKSDLQYDFSPTGRESMPNQNCKFVLDFAFLLHLYNVFLFFTYS